MVVDARALGSSGIGRYLREVLARMLADPRFAPVTLLGAPDELRAFVAGQGGEERVRVESYPHGFYSPGAHLHWVARRASAAARADVTFFPHYDAPFLRFPRRSVVTVHDLIHFRFPGVFPAWKRALAGRVLDRVVARAAHLLTVSEATRRDLVERCPAAAAKTGVVPNGVTPFFHAAGPGESVGPPPVPGPFLLCVGNRKPHKNVRAAVDVLARLRRERPELRLVVVGRRFERSDEVTARAEECGVRDALVELDEVDDRTLRGLYRACEVFLFPSLYEGFGLPVLEAMACGAPVVASDRSSVPEVVGDAGLLADPLDADAMAGAVRRLQSDPALRAEMVTRGHRRASMFTWDRSAALTLDVLHRVARS